MSHFDLDLPFVNNFDLRSCHQYTRRIQVKMVNKRKIQVKMTHFDLVASSILVATSQVKMTPPRATSQVKMVRFDRAVALSASFFAEAHFLL